MLSPALRRYPLQASRLFRLTTRRSLAVLLGITERDLQAVLRMERPYSERQTEIERNGKIKIRDIQEPRGALRPIHDRMRTLLSRIEPPDFLFCPVKGRSYVSNATRHLGAQQVRTLDIKAYFPSTPTIRIYWFFNHVMECSNDVSIILARLLTVNGHLATGSTASPILSFFAFYDMWNNIAALTKEANCTLSVYMDDVTISGPSVSEGLIWQIKRQIHSRGLQYHKQKNYYNGVAEVTGVLLRDGKAMIPNRQHQKAHILRTKLRDGLAKEQETILVRRLAGLKSQRKQIESDIDLKHKGHN